jgi:hypothetical protein
MPPCRGQHTRRHIVEFVSGWQVGKTVSRVDSSLRQVCVEPKVCRTVRQVESASALQVGKADRVRVSFGWRQCGGMRRQSQICAVRPGGARRHIPRVVLAAARLPACAAGDRRANASMLGADVRQDKPSRVERVCVRPSLRRRTARQVGKPNRVCIEPDLLQRCAPPD